jgi:uncharacterized GH25 family protein
MRRGKIGLGIAAALAATCLLAHDLFVEPATYFVEAGSQVEATLFNGTFRRSENTIDGERVAALKMAGPEGVVRLGWDGWDGPAHTTKFRVQVGESGTYALGVSTKPRPIELSGPDFNEYLAHDGIPDVLEARKRAGQLDRPVVERYAKHVKTLVQVGGGGGEGWKKSFGFPAEIVPVANPYELAAGRTLRVRVLVDGRPVGNQVVIAGGMDDRGPFEERQVRSDAEGIAAFEIDRPGTWYVKFIHMVETESEGIDYESKWATLTFEVR